jgi:hypothetical protein
MRKERREAVMYQAFSSLSEAGWTPWSHAVSGSLGIALPKRSTPPINNAGKIA